jgi:hypothetical protein
MLMPLLPDHLGVTDQILVARADGDDDRDDDLAAWTSLN